MSNQHSNQKIIKLVDSPDKNKNSKLYALNKDEVPEDNIFSKVLSGMKSVFNKPKKNKPKKSSPSERRTSREATSAKKLSKTTSSLISLSSNFASELTIKDTDINIGPDDPDIEISTDETDFSSKNQEETENENVPDYVLYTEDPDVIPLDIVENTVKGEIIPETEGAAGRSSLEEVIHITESVEVLQSLEIIPPVEEIGPSTALELEEPKAANSGSTPEKEGTAESSKHHKSKHTPKKKSRKKTKSRESEDQQASDTDEVSDSIPKVDSISISEKISSADPKNKPRIVLTFRSEKTGLCSTNMKIVSDNEKASEESTSTSRRSLRNKVALTGISELAIHDKKKSITVDKHSENQTEDKVAKGINSESDDSASLQPASLRRNKRNTSAAPSDSNSEDSPPVVKDGNVKRSARHRPKEQTDNVLANAMARKEKFYNEPSTSGTTRLSRRIKPTAKVLANRELRMGFETQNVARLALSTEVPLPPEEFKVTRSRLKRSPEKPNKISIMTAPKSSPDKNKKKKAFVAEVQEKKSADSEKPVKQTVKNQSMDEINRSNTGKAQSLLSLRCQKFDEDFNAITDENSHMQAFFTEEEREKRRLHKLKKKHLKKLGLKAVTDRKKKPGLPDREVVTDESTMDSTNTEAIVEHLNTRSKSFDFG